MAAGDDTNWQSFAPITPYDHAGYVWIAVLYSIIFSLMACFTRTYIKMNNLGIDDWLYWGATVACVAHVIALMVALHNGLGSVPSHIATGSEKAYSAHAYAVGGRATFAAAIFLLISLALAKCSVVMFMQRLLARDLKMLYNACYALTAVFGVWGLGSIIGISVGCSTSSYISDDAAVACGNQATKWWAIAAFDVITEAMLLAVPVIIVRPLQMSPRLKLEVNAAFMFRLGVVLLALLHAYYESRFATARSPSMALIRVIITAECELCWSLLSATIPNLKNFMRSFNTGFGHEFGLTTMQGSAYNSSGSNHQHRSKNGSGAIQLSKLSGGRKRSAVASSSGNGRFDFEVPAGLHPDTNGYEIEVGRGNTAPDNGSVGSGKSQEMIIRKDVTMTIEDNSGRRRTKNLF